MDPDLFRLDIPDLEIFDTYKANFDATILVIDMLNDFVHPDGALFVPDSVETIEPIDQLLGWANKSDIPFFFMCDSHTKDDKEFKSYPPHAIKGSWGSVVCDQLYPRVKKGFIGGNYLPKTTIDSFHWTDLHTQLAYKGTKTLILTGTVANICVLAAAHSASIRDYNLVVPLDCISALEEFGYWTALYQLQKVYGATLVKTASGFSK